MKILGMPIVIIVVIGAGLVSGGYVLGRSMNRNATVLSANMAQSNANKIVTLETQKAKLQADVNNLQDQLTKAQGVNSHLQEELVDRPTIIAPGTVQDLDGDEK